MVYSGQEAFIPTEKTDNPAAHRLMANWTVEEFPDPNSSGLICARVVSEADIVCEIAGAVVCGAWGRHRLHTDRARLIAAAPDLLAVLQELFCDGPVQVAFAGNPIACDALEQRVRAAIAKAVA